MADKRTYNLDIQPTLDLDQSFLVDDLAFGEVKRITGQTLLRTKPSNSFDRSGFSTAAISYDDYTTCNLTINQNCNVTYAAKTNETLYLYVTKGVSNIVTFSGANGTNDSKQIGLTKLKFRIDSVNGSSTVSQINSQFDDSLLIGNLTPTSGTITSFTYFNSSINNNICTFEGKFSYTPSSSTNSVQIDISNWNITKYNSGTTECVVGAFNAGGNVMCSATIDNDVMYLYFYTAIATATSILINGSFRIK